MHQLMAIRSEVERTMPGLGNLCAFLICSLLARRCVLVVSPSGTGKSAATTIVQSAIDDTLVIDSVTLAGLGYFSDALNGSQARVIVDDMGKVDTIYSRIATLTTFAELCYSHYVSKHSAIAHIVIENFRGAAVLNVQPVIMRGLIGLPQWEANVADKVLRYYHLYRPTTPSSVIPELTLVPNFVLENVSLSVEVLRGAADLLGIGLTQWSAPRAIEHISALLRSAAGIDDRDECTLLDVDTLRVLLRPLALEQYVLRRGGFEEERTFNSNLLYLAVTWATHGNWTLPQLMADYKLTRGTAYAILRKCENLWELTSKSPVVYAPSSRPIAREEDVSMVDILRKVGVSWDT